MRLFASYWLLVFQFELIPLALEIEIHLDFYGNSVVIIYMKKVYAVLIVAILLVLTGCSSKEVVSSDFSIVVVPGVGGSAEVTLVYYTDQSGDMYFRVLPNAEIKGPNVDGFNGYPVDWEKLPSPSNTP